MPTALNAVPEPVIPDAETTTVLRFLCDTTWSGSFPADGSRSARGYR